MSERTSVQRLAKRFEDEVAELYALLGAVVTQNIEICNKQVDVLATFPLPGSSTGHRVIVECKDEGRAPAQNQRLMHLKGLLDVARKADLADSAEVITRVPWGPLARGFALQAGIPLLTYREKVSKLIDFRRYLKDVIGVFRTQDPERPADPPLASYYVEPRMRRRAHGGRQLLDHRDYVRRWLRRRDATYQIAILSGYGTGKTSFCQELAATLAQSYLDQPDSPESRIPILLDLREFTKTLRMESLITSFLDGQCEVPNPRYTLFKRMNESGLLFVMLDAFDEMAARVDADALEINVMEIEKLAATGSAKILVTSREEYFINVREQERIFRPRGIKPKGTDFRTTEYEGVEILPWTSSQIDEFLAKRVAQIPENRKDWTYYRDQIRRIGGLRDLVRRPILLELIVRTLPDLVESDRRVHRPNLYESYLRGEIRRQRVQKRRSLLIGDEERFRLLEDVAVDAVSSGLEGLSFFDARGRIGSLRPRPPDSELEAYVRDFLTCSFLTKHGDEYRFSHRSIMEYLAARGLWRQLEAEELGGWERRSLPEAVIQFMRELRPDGAKDLSRLIQLSRVRPQADVAAGNAATLFARLSPKGFRGIPLREVVWAGANLEGADLRGAELTGAYWRNCSVVGAALTRRTLESIRFSNLKMAFVLVVEGRSQGAGREALERIYRTMRFSGVTVDPRTIFEQASERFAVGRVLVRVADSERLAWIEQRLGRERGMRWRVLCSDELERLVTGCPPNTLAIVRRAYATKDME